MERADNPRAVAGDNTGNIDFAGLEIARLRQEYEAFAEEVERLIAEADGLPGQIEDDETKGLLADAVKKIRDQAKRADGIRELEKMPHLRRGQGVDQFFFGLIDRLTKRDKRGMDGAGDRLMKIISEYDQRCLLAEQARRQAEAARLAAEAAAAKAEQDRLAAEAEAARLAAERARKPESIAAKDAAANAAEAAASEAAIEAKIAGDKAEEAYVDTLAKPAELVRTRTAAGSLATVAREFYAEVVDADALDKAALWPFIPLDAKEKALRAWAKLHGHAKPMTGAAIGSRPKSVVR